MLGFYVLLGVRSLASFLLSTIPNKRHPYLQGSNVFYPKKLLFGIACVKSFINKPMSRAKHINTQVLSIAPTDLCCPPNKVPTSQKAIKVSTI